jgi:hypothetical protein
MDFCAFFVFFVVKFNHKRHGDRGHKEHRGNIIWYAFSKIGFETAHGFYFYMHFYKTPFRVFLKSAIFTTLNN